MGKIKAIILAATENGGMDDDYFTGKTRHLLPVGEKSLVEYLIDSLKDEQIKDISIVIDETTINYKKHFPCLDSFNEIIKKYSDIKINLIGQNNLTNVGTYIAVKECLKKIKLADDDSILVLFGDLFINKKFLQEILAHFNRDKKPARISWGLVKYGDGKRGDVVVSKNKTSSNNGIIENDQIINIFEHQIKKPLDCEIYLDSGIMLISAVAWNRIQHLVKIIHRPSSFGIFSFTNIFKQALVMKNIQFLDYGIIELGIEGILSKDLFWYDVNYPWDLIHLNSILILEICSQKSWNAEKKNYIGSEVVYVPAGIEFFTSNQTHIKGPCILGKNIILGSFARIEQSYVSDNCIIESNANISGSIIGNSVHIHHGSVIDECIIMESTEVFCNCVIIRSIIGKKAMVGNHVRMPCQRLKKLGEDGLKDQKVIYFSETSIIRTEKFGSIVGDYCQIGAGTIIHPGRRIGKMTIIHANSQVLNNIRPKQVIKST